VTGSGWDAALLVATAVHAGFQLTVTCVVYPALASVPPPLWPRAHEQHSRRILPLVAVVYLALVGTATGAWVTGTTAATSAAAAATALTLGLTAGWAVRLHRQLGADHDPRLVARLLVVDRLRSVLALTALAAAVVAVLAPVPVVGG
jgi:hypothetical protein